MPSFLITIDTEGDNVWASPRTATTENAKFLPRFQNLCERFGFRPTWLVNYEMATSAEFVAFARAGLARGALEIGMHLHAWNSPPLTELAGAAERSHPYLVEYPAEVIRAKVEFITRLLRDTFQSGVTSHRAGRWAFDSRYAHVLAEFGYTVDCSVTPHVSWASSRGALTGGTDYRGFPDHAYFLDLDRIDRPGASDLLELPMTIDDSSPRFLRPMLARQRPDGPVARASRRLWPVTWLRPDGRNLAAMKRIIDRAAQEERPYVEFMLHSSELMPGGSPTFPDAEAIERLYADLEALFAHAARHFSGATLAEFRQAFVRTAT